MILKKNNEKQKQKKKSSWYVNPGCIQCIEDQDFFSKMIFGHKSYGQMSVWIVNLNKFSAFQSQ